MSKVVDIIREIGWRRRRSVRSRSSRALRLWSRDRLEMTVSVASYAQVYQGSDTKYLPRLLPI
jgi:hypothetical protein